MFPTMRRRLQQISDERALSILTKTDNAVLAIRDDISGYTYAVPVSPVYTDNHIYIHSAPIGHKIAAIKANPKAKYWSVSSNDNFGYCQCPACAAIDSLEGSPTGSVIRFVNQVAERFPDKIISTLAYQYSRAAPKVTKPRENVNIMFCNIECNRSQPIATDPSSASFRRDMEDWAALTDNILVWDYVIQFKKYAVSPADLLQFNTALNVAGDYQYYLSDDILYGAGLLILGIVLTKVYIPETSAGRKEFLRSKAIAAVSLVALIGWVHVVDFQQTYKISWNDWDTTKTYSQNGFMVSFITAAQRMKIDKPDGYSKEYAEEILRAYEPSEDDQITSQKPVIIAIMNESFSDLSDLGDLGETEDVMWYYDSLHCLEKGRTYVSVRGGGTCNSEFEFLTGNSLEFYNNIYPYTQFNFKNVPTVVSLLKDQGYKTIAMHPANPTNYGRESVYKEMGFDEFYSFEDYEQYEKVFLDRISDLDDYKEIVKVVNDTEDPVFIFNVTIQNHGDYDISTLNPKYEPVEMDEKYAEYKDAQMYFTLMNESNNALEYLIGELEEVSRPVILCMFGDHQPAPSESFNSFIHMDEVYRTDPLTQYQTPVVFWANYDIQTEEIPQIFSTNYLNALVAEVGGIPLNGQQKFLLEMMEQFPIYTTEGIYDSGMNEVAAEDMEKKYERIQYAMLRDPDALPAEFLAITR